ncbi:MAG: 2-oxoacid:acceptor oxidoreductase subunit alpha, partial [Candidatus Bathyarchaeia archaeon]
MEIVKSGVYFWQGNEACAEAAIVVGCRFFAGYPITPASEIAEHLAWRLPQVGGIAIQMEDE